MAKTKAAGPEIAHPVVRANSLMVCLGGPRHGAVYFETYGPAAWSEMRRCSEPGPTSTIHCYETTDTFRKHPRWPDLNCRVWNYVAPTENGGERGGQPGS